MTATNGMVKFCSAIFEGAVLGLRSCSGRTKRQSFAFRCAFVCASVCRVAKLIVRKVGGF